DFWLRAGPTWINATINSQLNWYQKYDTERNASNTYKLGWFVPGSIFSFRIDGSYLNTRERPGFEIDTRAPRTDRQLRVSLDYKALSKTYLGVAASRLESRFSEEAEYQGVNLQTSLNHPALTYGGNVRHTLTPLTSLTVSATHTDTTFEFSPDRD